MTFYVGQKVVCVDDGFPYPTDERLPKKGVVYTIRDIVSYPGFGVGVRLGEIMNEPRKCAVGVIERGFLLFRFRPAVSPKTSIKVFEEILDRAEKGEPVDA